MIERKRYLEQLTRLRDKQLIKIITGIRRCGKSTLLELFRADLIKNRVDEKRITFINFEDADNEPLTNNRTLYEHIKNRLVTDKINYIILDEIQHVNEWQKVVDNLFAKKNCDLYITGSNAYLLSSELATLLSGRYIEIRMLPLSFAEFVSAHDSRTDLARKFSEYQTRGSFPYVLELDDAKDVNAYLDGIYNSVILKDVVQRRKIADVSVLESVVRFMFDNIGNLNSIKGIADTLTASGRKVSPHTVENYLEALCDSFIIYKAGRYDVKGKQLLRTGDKYYVADIGLRHYLLGSVKADAGRSLENIVFLELLRRKYTVRVGKDGANEIDFVAAGENGVSYYQVALTVRDENTLARELRSLEGIKDHNPKFLLTLDDDPPVSHNGIKRLNALDWLLG